MYIVFSCEDNKTKLILLWRYCFDRLLSFWKDKYFLFQFLFEWTNCPLLFLFFFGFKWKPKRHSKLKFWSAFCTLLSQPWKMQALWRDGTKKACWRSLQWNTCSSMLFSKCFQEFAYWLLYFQQIYIQYPCVRGHKWYKKAACAKTVLSYSFSFAC
jgi:hypothetical protein